MSKDDIECVATAHNIEPALVWAIYMKESRGTPFVTHDGGRVPIILFEPHIFARYTANRYNQTHPHLSAPNWNTVRNEGRYNWTHANRNTSVPSGKDRQHFKLEQATALNRNAALMSASYGAFQIMGFNWETCGYTSLQSFINAMWKSEREHLIALFGFLRNTNVQGKSLLKWLREKRFDMVGLGYNGPGYRQNNWDRDVERYYNQYR